MDNLDSEDIEVQRLLGSIEATQKEILRRLDVGDEQREKLDRHLSEERDKIDQRIGRLENKMHWVLGGFAAVYFIFEVMLKVLPKVQGA